MYDGQPGLKKPSNSRSRSQSRRRSLDRTNRDSRRIRERSGSRDRGRRSADRRRTPRSTDSNSSSERGRSLDRHRDRRSKERTVERRRSTEKERDKNRRYSRERDKRTYEKRSETRRSYSRERGGYRERKKSLTPLRPGEYRRNHPDLRKRSREKHRYDRSRSRHSRSLSRSRPSTSKKRSRSPGRSASRSPKRSKTKHFDYYEKRSSRSPRPSGSRDRKHYARSPDYERDKRYKSERDRSRSPRRKDTVPYRDPSLDLGYYEGIPDFWMHPGIIRPPPYQMQRFYPPAFYPRVMPGGPVIYPPRHPIMPPIIRQKLPVYNSRAKPVNVAQISDKPASADKTDQNNDDKECTTTEVNTNEEGDKDLNETDK